jgi:hypothetical protein
LIGVQPAVLFPDDRVALARPGFQPLVVKKLVYGKLSGRRGIRRG